MTDAPTRSLKPASIGAPVYAVVQFGERPREAERVLWRSRAANEWVAMEAPSGGDDGSLTIAVVAGQTNAESIRTAEEWLDARDSSDRLVLTHKHSRVLFGRNHALIATDGGPEPFIEAVAAAWRVRRELDDISTTIDELWTVARRDIPLTHSVNRQRLTHVQRVNMMTVRVTELRFRIVELERLANGESLARESGRVLSGLLDGLHFEDRIELLSDGLEVMEDLYELANDRLTEFKFFHREYRLEILILVVLIIEVLQIFAEMFVLAR